MAFRLFESGSQVLLAFLIGACGMFVGSVISWQLLGRFMGPEGWKLASCLCASYIGGSVNFAAVGKVRQASRRAAVVCMWVQYLSLVQQLDLVR